MSSLPPQNAEGIQHAVEKYLKSLGLRPASEELFDPATRCSVAPQCRKVTDAPVDFERSLPQKVVQALVTPETRFNLLLRHDVGTGKTCAALSVASNFARQGLNVIWVARKSVAQAIQSNLRCFYADSAEGEFVGDADPTQGQRPEILVLNYVTLANLLDPAISEDSPTKKKLLDTFNLRNPQRDYLQNCLLILDEPHTLTELGLEGRKKLWNEKGGLLEEKINHSYRASGPESVTVLLLDATPLTNNLNFAARLLNLLIRDELKKLPLDSPKKKGPKPLTDMLLTNEGAEFKKRVRGYISWNSGSEDVTRFARPILHDVLVEAPVEFHNALQAACARGALDNLYGDKKAAQCYMERADYPIFLLNKRFKDFQMTANDADMARNDTILKRRERFLEEAAKMAPKVKALYDNIQRLDALDVAKKRKPRKHFIFCASKRMTTSAMVAASYFAANGHGRTVLGLNGDGEVTFDATYSEKPQSNYLLVGNSEALYREGTFKSAMFNNDNQTRIFNYLNKRPDNVHGENTRFIILTYKYKEGVNLFDIGYMHFLEILPTEADQTQAMGRALRMCGNCNLAADRGANNQWDGWSIPVFNYVIKPDRKPLISPTFVGRQRDEDETKKMFLEEVAMHREDCPGDDDADEEDAGESKIVRMQSRSETENPSSGCKPYGIYAREILSNPQEEALYKNFYDNLHEAAIDLNFYTLLSMEDLRERLAKEKERKRISHVLQMRLLQRAKQLKTPIELISLWKDPLVHLLPARVAGLEAAVHQKNEPCLRRRPSLRDWVLTYRCAVPEKQFDGMGVAILNDKFEVESDVIGPNSGIANVHLYVETRIGGDPLTVTYEQKSKMKVARLALQENGRWALRREMPLCADTRHPLDSATFIDSLGQRLIVTTLTPRLQIYTTPQCSVFSPELSDSSAALPFAKLAAYYSNRIRIRPGTNWVPFLRGQNTYLGVAEVSLDVAEPLNRENTPLAAHANAPAKFGMLVVIQKDEKSGWAVREFSDAFYVADGVSMAPRGLEWQERSLLLTFGDNGCEAIRLPYVYVEELLLDANRQPHEVQFFKICANEALCGQVEVAKRTILLAPRAQWWSNVSRDLNKTPWLRRAFGTQVDRVPFAADLKLYSDDFGGEGGKAMADLMRLALVPAAKNVMLEPTVETLITAWAPPAELAMSGARSLLQQSVKQQIPSLRAWGLFENRCHYYPWLEQRGYHVMHYLCLKAPIKPKYVTDGLQFMVKVAENAHIAPAGFVVTEKNVNETQADMRAMLEMSSQIVAQQILPEAESIKIWVVADHELQTGSRIVMSNNDALLESSKRLRRLPLKLFADMQAEVGPLWCAKFNLMRSRLEMNVWYVSGITLAMDMRGAPMMTNSVLRRYWKSLDYLMMKK